MADQSQFHQLLNSLLSTDNNVRTQAEVFIITNSNYMYDNILKNRIIPGKILTGTVMKIMSRNVFSTKRKKNAVYPNTNT